VRRDLLEILVCPICKGDLELTIEEEADEEIMRGSFLCKQCNEVYPIEDGIPNMLPPELRTV
jgi:uncharacterized protein YbaR (Trm112 family)